MWTLVNASYGVAMGQHVARAAEPHRRYTTPVSLSAVTRAIRCTQHLLTSLASVAFGPNSN